MPIYYVTQYKLCYQKCNILDNFPKFKTLGEIFKNHRKLQKKTIYEISTETSMSKSTLRDVELCLRNDINMTTFWKIAEGLNIPPPELLEEIRQKLGKNFSLTGLE